MLPPKSKSEKDEDTAESPESSSDEDEEAKNDREFQESKKFAAGFKKNPKAWVLYQRRMFLEEKVDMELELVVCKHLLKEGYDFLRIFQAKEVKIHLLYEAFNNLLKDVLIEICELEGLLNSKNHLLHGYQLKELVLETKE